MDCSTIGLLFFCGAQVNVKEVYLPGLHVGLFAPDPRATFSLYDRVINIRPDITIPLGLKGTVIGIHR